MCSLCSMRTRFEYHKNFTNTLNSASAFILFILNLRDGKEIDGKRTRVAKGNIILKGILVLDQKLEIVLKFVNENFQNPGPGFLREI